MKHALNLGEYLRRLGLRTGSEPQLPDDPRLTPVQVVHDATSLAPLTIAPAGCFGCLSLPASVSTYSVVRIENGWEGSVAVTDGQWLIGFNGNYIEVLTAAAAAARNFTNATTLPIQPFTVEPVRGVRIQHGRTTLAPPAAVNLPCNPASAQWAMPTLIIPPGHVAWLQSFSQNQVATGWANIEAFPAERPQ